MKKLTLQSAKSFAQKCFRKIKDKEERSFVIVHTKGVADTAVIIAKRLKADANAVAMAAWVHDIGKAIEDSDHAVHSVELLKKEFIVSDLIEDCVINHGTKGTPKSIEAKILQASDKLFIINIDMLKLLFK